MFGDRSDTDQPVESSGPPCITAVVAFSKGFACACGRPVVHLFEKSDDKECYRKTREILVCICMYYSSCKTVTSTL